MADDALFHCDMALAALDRIDTTLDSISEGFDRMLQLLKEVAVEIKASRVSPPTPAAPSVAMDGAVQQVLVGPTADDETLASPTPQPPATPVAPPTVINLLVGGELQPPANQGSIAPGPLPPVEAALVGADLRRRHLRPLWIRLSRPSRCPASVTADPSPPVASPTRVVRARRTAFVRPARAPPFSAARGLSALFHP